MVRYQNAPPPIAHFFALLCFSVVAGCQQEPSTVSEPLKRGDWKDYGCELVTDDEVAQTLSIDLDRDSLKSRTLPDQVFCLRTWNRKDWRSREAHNETDGGPYLNPYGRLVLQMIRYENGEAAQKQLNALRRDRRNTYDKDVPQLGEDALWSSTTVTLLCKKDQYIVSLSLEHADKPGDNLAKAQVLMGIALKKL